MALRRGHTLRTLIERSYFYLTEVGVEEELGALLQLVLLEEPSPEDFIDPCSVVNYYTRNVVKALTDVKLSNTLICSEDEAIRLVALTQGGGYVARCVYADGPAYVCELYYYTEDEL